MRCSLSLSNQLLARQVYELLVSLGVKPMRDSRITKFTHKGERCTGAVSYRVCFSVHNPAECFTLARHIQRYETFSLLHKRRPSHTGRRFIRHIEPVAFVPVRCIGVAHDSHLFAVGEQMVPTHNTDSLIINGLVYSTRVDPMDTLLFCPTQSAARDFSMRRVDRLFRHSPEVGKCCCRAKMRITSLINTSAQG